MGMFVVVLLVTVATTSNADRTAMTKLFAVLNTSNALGLTGAAPRIVEVQAITLIRRITLSLLVLLGS